MKKLNRNVLALLASLAIGFTSFSFVACSDNNDDGNNTTEVPQDKDKTTETQPAKNPEATTETYKGAFVVGKDSYTTLNIMSDKTYEMTDSLVEGTNNDWGTWELLDEIPPAQIYSRASALAKTNKNYKFTSKAHKTSDGKSGTILVETSPAGAAISEDTEAATKIEVSGVGLDTAEKIYKTEQPVTVENNTLNLTTEEIKNVFTLEAIEKGEAKKGVKITYKAPSSRTERKPNLISVTYVDNKGSRSTAGSYYNPELKDMELVFPYVNEDSYLTLVLYIEGAGKESVPDKFSAFYILNTKSGSGAIADLPENYGNWYPRSDSRITVSDGKLTVKDIMGTKIIPQNLTFSSLNASIAIIYTNSNDPQKSWDDAFWFTGYPTAEKTSADTYTFTSFPKPNKRDGKGYKYYFYQFKYEYTIEGDMLGYNTPVVDSAIFEVPENSFPGQTFTEPSYDYSDEYSKTWKFDKDTVSITTERSIDSSNVQTVVETYNYVPDEENSLLTLKLKGRSFKDSSQEISYASLEKAKDLLKKTYTGDKLAFEEDSLTAEFNTPILYKYDISDAFSSYDKKTNGYVTHYGNFINTYLYFDGNLPTIEEFRDNDDTVPVKLYGVELIFDDNETSYRSCPTFKDGKFSGTLYKAIKEECTENDKECDTVEGEKYYKHSYSKAGTIEGTYKATKKTISYEEYGNDANYIEYIKRMDEMRGGSWEITFTFTKLPETVTYIKTNTPYTIGRGH